MNLVFIQSCDLDWLFQGFFRTIVIDVGKTFQAAAAEWFPKYGLRQIDAVLLTHAHADGVYPGGRCKVGNKVD